MYNLCIIIRYQKHQMVAIRPTAGISPKSGKQQTEFGVTSRHEGPNFDSPEIKGDGDRQQLARWLFETIWNIVITTLVYVGPFCRSINLKNLFLCCIPSPTLDTIPTIPTWTCLQSFKNHLSLESWIMTNLIQGQNGQSQKKTNYRGEENHQKPRRQCPDGWMDGWTGQLELAAELW